LIQPILQYSESKDILTSKSLDISFDSLPYDFDGLLHDMLETVKGDITAGRTCWALSAIQINEPLRLTCMRYGTEYIFLVNPKILRTYGEKAMSVEGCMSILNGTSDYHVKRYNIIRVNARIVELVGNNVTSRPFTSKEHGIYAAVIQHEIDHMDGITLFERMKMD